MLSQHSKYLGFTDEASLELAFAPVNLNQNVLVMAEDTLNLTYEQARLISNIAWHKYKTEVTSYWKWGKWLYVVPKGLWGGYAPIVQSVDYEVLSDILSPEQCDVDYVVMQNIEGTLFEIYELRMDPSFDYEDIENVHSFKEIESRMKVHHVEQFCHGVFI